MHNVQIIINVQLSKICRNRTFDLNCLLVGLNVREAVGICLAKEKKYVLLIGDTALVTNTHCHIFYSPQPATCGGIEGALENKNVCVMTRPETSKY